METDKEPKKEYTGSWIPAVIMEDEEYTSTEKILFAEIQSLSNPWCFASNAFLMKRLNCSQKTVSEGIKRLASKGDILVNTDGNTRKMRCTDRNLVKITSLVKITRGGSKNYYPHEKNNRESLVKITTIDNIDNNIEHSNSRLPSLVDINGEKKSVSNIIFDLCSLFGVLPDRKGGYASKVKKFEQVCIDFINRNEYTYDELMTAAKQMKKESEERGFTPGVNAALTNTGDWLARAQQEKKPKGVWYG